MENLIVTDNSFIFKSIYDNFDENLFRKERKSEFHYVFESKLFGNFRVYKDEDFIKVVLNKYKNTIKPQNNIKLSGNLLYSIIEINYTGNKYISFKYIFYDNDNTIHTFEEIFTTKENGEGIALVYRKGFFNINDFYKYLKEEQFKLFDETDEKCSFIFSLKCNSNTYFNISKSFNKTTLDFDEHYITKNYEIGINYDHQLKDLYYMTEEIKQYCLDKIQEILK